MVIIFRSARPCPTKRRRAEEFQAVLILEIGAEKQVNHRTANKQTERVTVKKVKIDGGAAELPLW
jgi:hypothetical protein